MGDNSVKKQRGGSERRQFMRSLLDDLRALEMMLADGRIESGVRRIGAEQELFIVDTSWRPACAALKLLEQIDDPHFTTELAQFNLEVNLDPREFGSDCLSRMEIELNGHLSRARNIARENDLELVLAGILPTLRKSDLTLESMTPKPRYRALNDAVSALRGGAYEFHIKGLDELLIKHDSVMLEACNASFQVHFQVSAEEFANLYNIAQVVAAPVLAASVNSPMLFGRQLWRETRIALFQQAVDTRSSTDFVRERSPRVTFGDHWVNNSVLELFQDDVSRFRTLITGEVSSDPMSELAKGKTPELKALRLHNGTIYRWNRACYGITDGVPHLRIENRVFPSGPTVIDEMANAAFWFGLIGTFAHRHEDVRSTMQFADAKMNFNTAARLGLGAQFHWMDGETLPADKLICERLIPDARAGLQRAKIAETDVDRYMSVIEARVSSHRTGAKWAVQSMAGMHGKATTGEQLNALTAATVSRQVEGKPVSEWEPARLEDAGGWQHNYLRVEQYMSTDLYTVTEDESLDLVASLMEWKRIRHVPVEDRDHRLVGLVSYRSMLRLMARGILADNHKNMAVHEVMARDLITVSPDDSTLKALDLMRSHGVSCLPVVNDDRLVGVITERDFMNVAGELLTEQLRRR